MNQSDLLTDKIYLHSFSKNRIRMSCLYISMSLLFFHSAQRFAEQRIQSIVVNFIRRTLLNKVIKRVHASSENWVQIESSVIYK